MMPDDELPPDTDPDLSNVLDELVRREPIFHRPEWGTSRSAFEKMTAADFWEVGASGRRYRRETILAELERRYQTTPALTELAMPWVETWEASDFCCRKLADDVFLLTYTLLQDNRRKTRRATIWRHTSDGWKILYHQGTIVQAD